MSKYDPLTRYLAARNDARVRMRFSEIEALLGFPLPKSARTHRPWWANTAHGHTQAKGWLAAGYESHDVDLGAEQLMFQKLNVVEKEAVKNHPIFGAMAGTFTIMPGFDLTEPTAPEWEDQLLEKFDRVMGRAG